MARIKEQRLCENGDFDILISFSRDDISKMGIDSINRISSNKAVMEHIWSFLQREICEDNKRTFGQ